MSDCLQNEDSIVSDLSSSNTDTLTGTLDSDNNVNSDVSVDDAMVSSVSNGDSMDSNLGEDGSLYSELVIGGGGGAEYTGQETDSIVVDVDNNKYTISASLKPIKFNSVADFPKIGSEKLIYVDFSNKALYGWDSTKSVYYKLVADVKIPTKLTEFTNDAGFITNTVNDLVEYYKKTETYSQAEIDSKISVIPKFDIKVVAELPTTNISESTVYLVPSDGKDQNIYVEYIYVDNKWEKLGEQSLGSGGTQNNLEEINMSGFYTNEQGKAIKFAEGNVSLQASMPVGSIFPSAIPIIDRRVHLLDGTTISQEGTYENFAILIKALISAGYNITCTQKEFDTSVSTYGQCGKFVVDDDAKTIRLPLITEFIASNNGGKEIGLAELDMFKSHMHDITSSPNQNYNGSTTYQGTSNWGGIQSTGSASGNAAFYAAHTGGSETRPKNIRYPYYIVLASGFKTNADIIIDPFINDVEKIKSEYIKSATIADDVLKITDQNNNTIEFQGGGGGGLITLNTNTNLMDLEPNIYHVFTGSGFFGSSIRFYYDGSATNSYVNIRNGFINVTDSYDSYNMTTMKQFFGDVYIEGSLKDGVPDTRSGHVFIMGFGSSSRGNCTFTFFDGNDVIATRTWVNNNTSKTVLRRWTD